MKNTLVFIVLLSFISCNNNKAVQGIWVSSYSQNEDGGKMLPIAAKKVIEFTNDSIHIRGVKSFPYNHYDGKYKVGRNILKIDDSISIGIIGVSTDSLILEDNNKSKIVYKRLNNTLKSHRREFNLKGRSFRINYPTITDTIRFLNDSVLISEYYGMKRNWDLISYKGFDILMIDDNFDLPLIIKGSKGGNIDFTVLDSKQESVTMNELIINTETKKSIK